MKISFVIKFIFANCVALFLASFALFLYEGPSFPLLPANGITTGRRPPNKQYFQFVEGCYVGRFDSRGYNNRTTEQQNNIAILLLGSSHFEARQVFPDKNLSSLLSSKLEQVKAPETTCNLGMSGNSFPFVVTHYENALEKNTPSKYAVVEFAPDIIDLTQVKKALDSSLLELDGSLLEQDIHNRKRPLLKKLISKIRFIVLLENALMKYFVSINRPIQLANSVTLEVNNTNKDNEFFSDLQQCFQILAQSSQKHDVQCLILFRPRLEITPDGSLQSTSSPEYVQQLKTLSENEGLVFIDMTSRMISEYNEKKILPYGFWNTFPNSGHCNKEGHRMMAEAIYAKIIELENSKEEETK